MISKLGLFAHFGMSVVVVFPAILWLSTRVAIRVASTVGSPLIATPLVLVGVFLVIGLYLRISSSIFWMLFQVRKEDMWKVDD